MRSYSSAVYPVRDSSEFISQPMALQAGDTCFMLSGIPSSTFPLICYLGKREIVLYFILTFLLFAFYLIWGKGKISLTEVTKNYEKFGWLLHKLVTSNSLWNCIIFSRISTRKYICGSIPLNLFFSRIHLFLEPCEFWQIGGARTNSLGSFWYNGKGTIGNSALARKKRH